MTPTETNIPKLAAIRTTAGAPSDASAGFWITADDVSRATGSGSRPLADNVAYTLSIAISGVITVPSD